MTADQTPRPARRPSTPVQHRASTTVLGLVLPLVLLTAGVALGASWRDDLPAQVAIHWSADGPDGFSSLTALLVGTAVGTGALVVLLWAFAFWGGRARPVRQLSAGLGTGVAGLVAALTVGTLAPQRGLADGADAGGVGWAVAVALVIGTALGLAAAALVRRQEPSEEVDAPREDVPRLPLAEGERVAWVRRTTSSTGATVVGLGAVLLTAAVLVGGSLWLLLVPLAVGLLIAAMFSWVVSVDATGLTVRSALGIPSRHLSIDEIVDATVDTVNPLRDFGGYGWRTSPDGRTGVVIRAGEALEVRSTGERRFVVTVDDAATAAALLTSLADRRRADEGAGPGTGAPTGT